ncbi:MAG: prepilin-type N-terminal cleavage/methylation domain-containing protein [Planctomycetota bacterium]|nr:prepilin-type N-terminal cleavage/methylation domain-containing protein [Planctomycetota bacterium]
MNANRNEPRLPRNPCLRTARGFTMLEILVVIGIILLVVTLMVGGWADMLQARRLGGSVERVVNTISLARNLAIQDKAITHVRIENRGPNDQWVGVYRFAKVSDALAAVSESAVQSKGGWSEPLVKQLDKQKLDINVFFETQYDPASMWDDTRGRPRMLELIHPSLNTLYYSGRWTTATSENPYAVYLPDAFGNAINLLPKQASYTGGGNLSGAPQHALLSFNPDGSASANVILFVRDHEKLRYVQVWRGGVVRSGDITVKKEFDKLQ